jgi:hypothetical protein
VPMGRNRARSVDMVAAGLSDALHGRAPWMVLPGLGVSHLEPSAAGCAADRSWSRPAEDLPYAVAENGGRDRGVELVGEDCTGQLEARVRTAA